MSWLRGLVSLLLALGLFAACDSAGDSKGKPESGATTVRPESVDKLADSPFGKVLTWSATGPNVVWAVTTATKSCKFCAALWKKQGDAGWRRVHTFAEVKRGQDDGYGYTPVDHESLAMSADGKHGLFQWETSGLMRTTDGGRTWAHLPAPKGDHDAKAFGFGVHKNWFVMVDGRGRVWRTAVGQVAWEEITPDGVGRGIDELRSSQAGLALTVVTPRGESVLLSTDAGGSWQTVSSDRMSEQCMVEHASVEVLVSSCERYGKASWSEASTDGGKTWKRGPDFKYGTISGVFPVGQSGSVVVERNLSTLVLVREDGTSKELPMRTAPSGGEFRAVGRNAVFYSDDVNLFRSRDGAETWEQISPDRVTG
ncbi:hypothetical protein ncot_10100 [Nocardioides sp. JQ2195]|uniref:hypothetical protein n=1 Tax=Nocardioides sp. JQ2195 TaxID=2592334 RepID=UPI00143E753D|nr:hypothetical protein [Nocardioides sp. JQ2195]QIX26917.1 hypothetical protein ncot_10100 [Nocardioides sp. JQ2195]